jgi:predicted PurR-regulated permease PerM
MASVSEHQKVEPISGVRLAENVVTETATAWRSRATFVILTVLGLSALVYGLWVTRVIVLLIFAGALVGLVLSSICGWIETRTRLRRRWSLSLTLLTIAGVLWLGIWLRGPAIENQIDQLHDALPQAASSFAAQLRTEQWGRWLVNHGFGLEQLPRAMDVLPKVTGVVSSTLGFLAGLAIVFFLGVVIAAEPQTYIRGFERLFPAPTRTYVDYVATEIAHALRWWLFARFMSMLAVGVMVFLGLWMLAVPMAGTLGVLAALLAFIPNIGPVLSAIPPVLLAFSNGPRQALFVILLFWAVHAIEGFLITPIVERAAVHLPPALTLSVQLLLAVLIGAMGIALAAPITTIAVVLVRTVYRQKILNE